jgi:Flp pilus assembly protein CpaB
MPPAGDAPPSADRRARLRRAVRRTVLARRRPLAALCAGIAVLAGVQAVRPGEGATVAVPVAAHDLDSGTVLSAGDLSTRRLPVGSAPDGLETHAVGRTLAGPIRRGEPVTDARLVAPALIAGYPGRVALPVRIADADVAGLLRVGDHVDLVAADPRSGTASYVAVDVPVVALPAPDEQRVGSSASGVTGRLVVVAAVPSDVDGIAGAAATDLLSVVISR